MIRKRNTPPEEHGEGGLRHTVRKRISEKARRGH